MERSIVDKADMVAEAAHRGQVRKYNGEPYIVHPRRVAERVSRVPGATENMIAAAKLHDVLEDTEVDSEALVMIFGHEITTLVQELTNPSKSMDRKKTTRKERKAVDVAHLKEVSWEAKIIKLCDRIDNLNDMIGADDDFLALYQQESMVLATAIGDANFDLEKELFALTQK